MQRTQQRDNLTVCLLRKPTNMSVVLFHQFRAEELSMFAIWMTTQSDEPEQKYSAAMFLL